MKAFVENTDFLFMEVGREHRNRISQVLGKLGLHRGQPHLLLILGKEDGLPHSHIAKIMGVTPATTSNMVKRLERDGFVIRRRDSEDERVSRVYLTEKGREMLVEVKVVMQEMNQLITRGFSDEEITDMRSYLYRILENLREG